jgi:hypothetical protein
LQAAPQGIPDSVPSSTDGPTGKEMPADGKRSGAHVAVKREAQTSSPTKTKTKKSRNVK